MFSIATKKGLYMHNFPRSVSLDANSVLFLVNTKVTSPAYSKIKGTGLPKHRAGKQVETVTPQLSKKFKWLSAELVESIELF